MSSNITRATRTILEVAILLEGALNEIQFMCGIGQNVFKNTKDKNGQDLLYGNLIDLFIVGLYDGLRLSSHNVALDAYIAADIEQNVEMMLDMQVRQDVIDGDKKSGIQHIAELIQDKYETKKAKVFEDLAKIKDVNIKEALLKEDIFPENLLKKVVHKNNINKEDASQVVLFCIEYLEMFKAMLDAGSSVAISAVPKAGYYVGSAVGFLCTYAPRGEELIRNTIQNSLKTYISNQYTHETIKYANDTITYLTHLVYSAIKGIIGHVYTVLSEGVSLAVVATTAITGIPLNFLRTTAAGVYDGLVTNENKPLEDHITTITHDIKLLTSAISRIIDDDFNTAKLQIAAEKEGIIRQQVGLLGAQKVLIEQLEHQINVLNDMNLNNQITDEIRKIRLEQLEIKLEAAKKPDYIEKLTAILDAESRDLDAQLKLLEDAKFLGNTSILSATGTETHYIRQNISADLFKMDKEFMKLRVREIDNRLNSAEHIQNKEKAGLYTEYNLLKDKLSKKDTWKNYCNEIITQQIKDYKIAKNTQMALKANLEQNVYEKGISDAIDAVPVRSKSHLKIAAENIIKREDDPNFALKAAVADYASGPFNQVKDAVMQARIDGSSTVAKLASQLASKSMNYTLFPKLTKASEVIIDSINNILNCGTKGYSTIVEYLSEFRLMTGAAMTLAIANTYNISKWTTQNICDLITDRNQQSLEK